MSDSTKDRIKENLEKAKVEGTNRAGRIREILQSAFSQTLTEVKEGSGEIRSIATQSIAVVIETINPQFSTADPSEKSVKAQVLTLFQAIRNRLTEQWQTLNTNLTTQYGDRYEAVKQRWNKMVIWYNNARANSETPLSDQLQQRQAVLEEKIGNAGVSIAQKEQQIRDRVRTLFQTATAKF